MIKNKPLRLALSLVLTCSILTPMATTVVAAEETKETITQIHQVVLPTVGQLEQAILDTKVSFKHPKKANIKTKDAFFKVLDEAYGELPNKITLTNSISKQQAEAWHSEYLEKTIPSEQKNVHTLANYSVRIQDGNLVLVDNAHRKFYAKRVQTGLEQFAADFAKAIEGLSNDQKIQVIYDYVFNQYTYKASSFYEMMVGNAYTTELACNGFTRLFYELAEASGVASKMIEAEDHFYNHVQLENEQWVIIDLSTDILLKARFGATGLSQKDYLAYVSKVGFYWAKPVDREKAVAESLTKEEKEAFLNQRVPSIEL